MGSAASRNCPQERPKTRLGTYKLFDSEKHGYGPVLKVKEQEGIVFRQLNVSDILTEICLRMPTKCIFEKPFHHQISKWDFVENLDKAFDDIIEKCNGSLEDMIKALGRLSVVGKVIGVDHKDIVPKYENMFNMMRGALFSVEDTKLFLHSFISLFMLNSITSTDWITSVSIERCPTCVDQVLESITGGNFRYKTDSTCIKRFQNMVNCLLLSECLHQLNLQEDKVGRRLMYVEELRKLLADIDIEMMDDCFTQWCRLFKLSARIGCDRSFEECLADVETFRKIGLFLDREEMYSGYLCATWYRYLSNLTGEYNFDLLQVDSRMHEDMCLKNPECPQPVRQGYNDKFLMHPKYSLMTYKEVVSRGSVAVVFKDRNTLANLMMHSLQLAKKLMKGKSGKLAKDRCMENFCYKDCGKLCNTPNFSLGGTVSEGTVYHVPGFSMY